MHFRSCATLTIELTKWPLILPIEVILHHFGLCITIFLYVHHFFFFFSVCVCKIQLKFDIQIRFYNSQDRKIGQYISKCRTLLNRQKMFSKYNFSHVAPTYLRLFKKSVIVLAAGILVEFKGKICHLRQLYCLQIIFFFLNDSKFQNGSRLKNVSIFRFLTYMRYTASQAKCLRNYSLTTSRLEVYYKIK